MAYFLSFIAGVAGFALFLVIAFLVTSSSPTTTGGRRNWQDLIDGADGRLSTSKFQWFAWTGVIAGSYLAVYVARILTNSADPLPADIPGNVLIALGFSATTMATAKGITTMYLAGGRVAKDPSPSGSTAGGLVTDDTGITDLSKVQLMTWTVIALAAYLYSVANQIGKIIGLQPHLGLPDIDGSLMVLTGLSQGGYIGKKLTTTSQVTAASQIPTLSTLISKVEKPGGSVALYGANFGPPAPDSYLTLDGVKVAFDKWDVTRIDFVVPAQPPAGSATVDWPAAGQVVDVAVVIAGQPMASTLPLKVVL